MFSPSSLAVPKADGIFLRLAIVLAFLPWFEFMADNKLVASTIAGRQYRQICIQRSTGAHNILSLLNHVRWVHTSQTLPIMKDPILNTDQDLLTQHLSTSSEKLCTKSHSKLHSERTWKIMGGQRRHCSEALFGPSIDRSITALLIGAVRDDSFKLIRPHSQCRFWWSKKNTLDHTRMSEALSGKFTVPIMKELYHFICKNMIVIGIISDLEP